MHKQLTWSLFFVVLLTAVQAGAENWPRWRGPNFDGTAAGQDYPLSWSKTDNILWKVELGQRGSSTPIVWKDHIFLTVPFEGENRVLCLDRDGQEQWEVSLGEARPGKHKKASGANPSPCTDGEFVYAYFKSGDLACLDFAGNILWRKNLQELYGEDTLWWDLGTSPVLTKKHVVVAVMQSGPSYLVALDKASGEVAWKQDRNLDAPLESSQSYSTPVVIERDGAEQLIVLGADHVTAHNAADGKEIWRVGGLNPTGEKYYRSIASPVVVGDVVVAPYARGKTVTGIRLGGQGDVTESHVIWTQEGIGTDVPTPLAGDGKVYVLRDKGEVVCLDVKTGEKVWSGRVEKHRNAFSASPVGAGDRMYLVREDGTTLVVEQGPELKLLTKNELDEFTVATPVLVDGKIYLRTTENLYCIGQ